jgi:hypothetical protein
MRRAIWVALGLVLTGGWLLCGCAYRVSTGPLAPLPDDQQMPGSEIADDGSVTHSIQRLEVRLRPMRDEELNRQFPQLSDDGNNSGNPYTYGNWMPRGAVETPSRFAVFELEVENYEFPKVLIDPTAITMQSANGRDYRALPFQHLREYYYPYNQAYAGDSSSLFENRKDILRSTMYPPGEPVFAGQSTSGYVVFPRLHDDVREVTVHVPQVALRFDYRDEPVEVADLEFHFERTVQRVADR